MRRETLGKHGSGNGGEAKGVAPFSSPPMLNYAKHKTPEITFKGVLDGDEMKGFPFLRFAAEARRLLLGLVLLFSTSTLSFFYGSGRRWVGRRVGGYAFFTSFPFRLRATRDVCWRPLLGEEKRKTLNAGLEVISVKICGDLLDVRSTLIIHGFATVFSMWRSRGW